MDNNILYKGSIDCDWLRFKEVKGITVGESGKTMECVSSFPSTLYLDYDKNPKNEKRKATVTITQLSSGKSSAITFTQKANLAGKKNDGDEYLNKSLSYITITAKLQNGETDFTTIPNSSNTIELSAICTIVKSQKWIETDEYGDVIASGTTDRYLEKDKDVTNENECKWSLTSDSNKVDSFNFNENSLEIKIPDNDSYSSRRYMVMAEYSGLTGYTSEIRQEGKAQIYIYTVETNSADTIVHIVSLDPKLEITAGTATLDGSSYKFECSSEKSNLYAYVEKESGYTDQSIIVKSGGTEILDYIKISSGGINSWIQVESSVNLTTYKSVSNKDNPIKLKKDDAVTISTEIDKKQKIIPSITYALSDNWIIVSPLSNNIDYNIQVGQSEENRKGIITFSFVDNIYGIKEKTITIQQFGNAENQ